MNWNARKIKNARSARPLIVDKFNKKIFSNYDKLKALILNELHYL